MTEFTRDRWGRPLIPPPGGGDTQPYTRVSTLAKALDDTSNLMDWKARLTAVGLAKEPSLLDRVTSLVNLHPDPVRDARRDLNGIVRSAGDAAGGKRAADTGTSLHEFTQVIDSGAKLTITPARWQAHLDVYRRATAGLSMLECETFVVNDEVRAAGTFDRLVRLPDGRVVVGDVKTGRSDPDYPLAVATQVATYANGKRCDLEGTRSPIHPDLDLTTGLLIHLPSSADNPRCTLHLLDLRVGWKAARLATEVRAMRGARGICTDYTMEVVA